MVGFAPVMRNYYCFLKSRFVKWRRRILKVASNQSRSTYYFSWKYSELLQSFKTPILLWSPTGKSRANLNCQREYYCWMGCLTAFFEATNLTCHTALGDYSLKRPACSENSLQTNVAWWPCRVAMQPVCQGILATLFELRTLDFWSQYWFSWLNSHFGKCKAINGRQDEVISRKMAAFVEIS